jgi:hypothetical protein
LSGSLSRRPKLAPLGQMKPLLNGSFLSPRTLTTLPSSFRVSSSPHMASHSGHVLVAVRVMKVCNHLLLYRP